MVNFAKLLRLPKPAVKDLQLSLRSCTDEIAEDGRSIVALAGVLDGSGPEWALPVVSAWLFDLYRSEDQAEQEVVLLFIPEIVEGLLLKEGHKRFIEAIALNIYNTEVASGATARTPFTVPSLTVSSLYHNKKAGAATVPLLTEGALSRHENAHSNDDGSGGTSAHILPTLQRIPPPSAVGSETRAAVIGVLVDTFHAFVRRRRATEYDIPECVPAAFCAVAQRLVSAGCPTRRDAAGSGERVSLHESILTPIAHVAFTLLFCPPHRTAATALLDAVHARASYDLLPATLLFTRAALSECHRDSAATDDRESLPVLSKNEPITLFGL